MGRRGVGLWVLLALVGCAANPPASRVLDAVPLGPTTSFPLVESSVPSTAATSTTATSTTATTTAGTTTAGTTAATRPEGSVSMAFSGDVLIHRPIVARALANGGGAAYDFAPMFARLAPLVSSVDLAVCHLETPVAPSGEELSGHPIYGIPREIAPAIAATGWDRCSTASNHTLDRGLTGIDATVDVLAANGVGSSGMARTPEESEPHVFTVNGIRFSHLAYTFGFNGLSLPKGQEWRAKLLDADRVIADARLARERGAEYVFVSFHWGEERSWRITPGQRAIAEQVTASGAVDLIVGHHVHVLQPIETVNGHWVVYGMGSLISNLGADPTWPAASPDADVVTLTVTRRPDGGFDTSRPVVHPTWIDPDGFLVRLVQDDLADPATAPGLAARLRASLDRTRQVLGDYVP